MGTTYIGLPKKYVKIILVILINTIIFSVLLEIGTPFIYSKIFERKFNQSEIKKNLDIYSVREKFDFNQIFSEANFIANKALHPYLGYVYDTKKNINQRSEYFGFGNNQGILNNSIDTMKIVITGGSVAQGLFNNAKEKIIKNITKSNVFGTKNIKIFNLAIGGFKQPQQLMVLNYFLSLGGKFDIWINLDGFNEVTLPIEENLRNNVTISYPRLWNLYARKSIEKNVIDKMVAIEGNRQSRKRIASLLSSTILVRSSFCLTLWEIYDQKLANKEYQLSKELSELTTQKTPSYQISGPLTTTKSWQDLLVDSVNIWKRTSLLMDNICSTNGIKYFHFLQPNQYVKGTKNLSDEEKIIAYENGSYAYKALVEVGYPLLINEGNNIKKLGVDYIDLTMIFKNEKKTVYSDKCCHFNKFGYEQIADKISDVIIIKQ